MLRPFKGRSSISRPVTTAPSTLLEVNEGRPRSPSLSTLPATAKLSSNRTLWPMTRRVCTSVAKWRLNGDAVFPNRQQGYAEQSVFRGMNLSLQSGIEIRRRDIRSDRTCRFVGDRAFNRAPWILRA